MKKGRVPPAVPAEPHLSSRLRDPETALAYLNEAAKDNDPATFLLALRDVAEVRGGISRIASKAGLNRQQLYKTLSDSGNPELRSLTAILSAAGFGLSVRPLRRVPVRPRTARVKPGGPSASPRTA